MKCSKCKRAALCGTALQQQSQKGTSKPALICHACLNPEVPDTVLDEVGEIIPGDQKTTQ